MSDLQSDRIAPWTIKGIAPEARNAAIAAAGRDNMTLGEWFSRNIPLMIQADRARTRMPAVVEQSLQANLTDIERLVAMATDLAAATQKPLPRSVARPVFSMLRTRMQAAADQQPPAPVWRAHPPKPSSP